MEDMLTYALMVVFVICFLFSALWKVRYHPFKNAFMSIDDTIFQRGLWCIIVVLVHVPTLYQNKIQDLLGSFAYIGVTFFFMTSAYGLKFSLKYKKGYMKCFWRKRIPLILIPALIANAFGVIVRTIDGDNISFCKLLDIHPWVKVLLLYYIIFWLVYRIIPELLKINIENDGNAIWQDLFMCIVVLGFSLVDRLTEFKVTLIWTVEPLGFAYGIIIANHIELIKEYIVKNWLKNSIYLMTISLVLGIAYLKFKFVFFVGDYFLKALLGISITIFIFTILSRVKVGNRVSNFLGGISYEVFLLHDVSFVLVGMIPKINSRLFICLSILLTIMLSFLLNRFCRIILHKK